MLQLALVRHASLVLAGDVGKVVNSRWYLKAVLSADVAILDDIKSAAGCHCCQPLEGLPIPAIDVAVRHRNETPWLLRLVRGAVNSLAPNAVEI